MKIINFISGKDLGGPKQSFILYSEVLINLGFEVRSVIRQGAPLKEIMQSMDINIDEINYIRTTHPWFIKKSIQNLRRLLLPMNASVVFVHKQLDIELVRGALGNNIKIVGKSLRKKLLSFLFVKFDNHVFLINLLFHSMYTLHNHKALRALPIQKGLRLKPTAFFSDSMYFSYHFLVRLWQKYYLINQNLGIIIFHNFWILGKVII